jgi:hypothetical protein
MKTSFLRFASRSLAVSALVLLLGQSAAWAGGNHWPFKRITGVWNARVNITNCLPGNVPGPIVFASFDAMNVYAADGTFLDTNSTDPTTHSSHFGYWRHIRGNRYEFAQRFFVFNTVIAGQPASYRIVRHEVLLDRTGLSFTSGGYAQTFAQDGTLLATGCSTSSAVRFD